MRRGQRSVTALALTFGLLGPIALETTSADAAAEVTYERSVIAQCSGFVRGAPAGPTQLLVFLSLTFSEPPTAGSSAHLVAKVRSPLFPEGRRFYGSFSLSLFNAAGDVGGTGVFEPGAQPEIVTNADVMIADQPGANIEAFLASFRFLDTPELAPSTSGVICSGASPSLVIPILPRLTCDGRTATIVGTETADELIGTDSDDVIVALGGDDIIVGRGGNDVICAGEGNDVLFGMDGRDRMFGNPGNDTLLGGAAWDFADGGRGRSDWCLDSERRLSCERSSSTS